MSNLNEGYCQETIGVTYAKKKKKKIQFPSGLNIFGLFLLSIYSALVHFILQKKPKNSDPYIY